MASLAPESDLPDDLARDLDVTGRRSFLIFAIACLGLGLVAAVTFTTTLPPNAWEVGSWRMWVRLGGF